MCKNNSHQQHLHLEENQFLSVCATPLALIVPGCWQLLAFWLSELVESAVSERDHSDWL